MANRDYSVTEITMGQLKEKIEELRREEDLKVSLGEGIPRTVDWMKKVYGLR